MATVAAVIQARLGSSRLPGKVLLPLHGQPVIKHVLDRVLAADVADCVVLATTTGEDDDELAAYVSRLGVTVVRGSTDDVLSRVCKAMADIHPDLVARITADDPCKDPNLIRIAVRMAVARWPDCDYVSNIRQTTCPDGLDVEVVSARALQAANREATLPSDREHVTPFVWRHAERFRVYDFGCDGGEELRVTLDDEVDLQVLQELFDEEYPKNPLFGLAEIREFFRRNPELVTHNQRQRRNEAYWRQVHQESGA